MSDEITKDDLGILSISDKFKTENKEALEKARKKAKEKEDARRKDRKKRIQKRKRQSVKDYRKGGMVLSTVDNRKNK